MALELSKVAAFAGDAVFDAVGRGPLDNVAKGFLCATQSGGGAAVHRFAQIVEALLALAEDAGGSVTVESIAPLARRVRNWEPGWTCRGSRRIFPVAASVVIE